MNENGIKVKQNRVKIILRALMMGSHMVNPKAQFGNERAIKRKMINGGGGGDTGLELRVFMRLIR